MSFRQIFDRLARFARSEMHAPGRSSFEEELRRAQELIEESRRPRRTSVEDDPASARNSERPAERSSQTAPRREEEYYRALRTIGAPDDATPEQITAAFRERAREVHPDRLEHLSPALQRDALRRMQELNLAYEYLRRRRGA